jgi:hypothetical protein
MIIIERQPDQVVIMSEKPSFFILVALACLIVPQLQGCSTLLSSKDTGPPVKQSMLDRAPMISRPPTEREMLGRDNEADRWLQMDKFASLRAVPKSYTDERFCLIFYAYQLDRVDVKEARREGEIAAYGLENASAQAQASAEYLEPIFFKVLRSETTGGYRSTYFEACYPGAALMDAKYDYVVFTSAKKHSSGVHRLVVEYANAGFERANPTNTGDGDDESGDSKPWQYSPE